MGRHKKILQQNSLLQGVLQEKGFADSGFSYDVRYKKFLCSLESFMATYGLGQHVYSELESKEIYDRLQASGRASFPGALVPITTPVGEYVLRPELKSQVIRSYIENNYKDVERVSRVLTLGNTFTSDIDGRIAKDYRFGVFQLGSLNHLAIAQSLSALWFLFKSVGFEDLSLEVNCVGEVSSRKNYQDDLYAFVQNRKFDICDECAQLTKKNIINIFHCANYDCRVIASEGPIVLDYLEDTTAKQFTCFLESLDEVGLPYQLNHVYMGSIDYCKIVFNIKYTTNDLTIVLVAGGELDELIAICGGGGFRSFGYEVSIDRILPLITVGLEETVFKHYEVFLVPLGELASKVSLKLFHDLVDKRVNVYNHFGLEGIKNQLKSAQTYGAPVALIIGQKEAQDGMVILRDVKSGMQEMFRYEQIVNEVMKRLGR